MKKMIMSLFIVLFLAVTLFYFVFPGTFFQLATMVERSSVGLSKKSIQVDNHRIVFLEGGHGETILLIHGYAANKDNWTRFSRYLTKRYHVVIPDLAGFGESSRIPEDSYDYQSQVDRLYRFTEVLKLQKFHLAGNSMGGQMAAMYGAQYPRKVLSLGLLAPAGIKSPEKSDAYKILEKGENPWKIRQEKDFDALLGLAFVKIPMIPPPVKKVLAQEAMKNGDFNLKIRDDLWIKKPQMLEPFLPKIQAPSLILWGDRDRILHVSSVPALELGIKRHQTVIMKDCGHMPMIERPEEAAGYYIKFLSSI